MAMPSEFDSLKMGAILVIVPDADASPLPLERTSVNGQIVGAVASVRVRQQFGNPFKTPIELTYLFPLPHEAAVVDYTITIGERQIRADIKELEAARRTYEEAVSEGKRASLLEQRRPNLFALKIGNVQPNEHIITELVYEDRLPYKDGVYEFVFPMGITPRYHTPSQPASVGQSADAPLAVPGERIAPVELNLSIDAGIALEDPASTSHTFALQRQSATQVSLSLPDGTIPNKDFVLRYHVAASETRAAMWSSTDGESETLLVTVLPPRLDTSAEAPPREFIYVIDRSGSMSVEPMEQAKNALRASLRALGERDTFYIQAFDNHLEWFSQAAHPVTQASVDSADSWLNQIQSRGGTEILPAIDAALSLPPDKERQRYVVFLTDGAVSADEQAIRDIGKKRKDARIFTFGIGPSVNRYLLDKMAQMGRGTVEFLGAQDDIESAITRFQDRVSYPALMDIKLEWDGANSWDTYPDTLPDLYVGFPLEIVTRLKRSSGGTLRLVGKQNGREVRIEVPIPPAQASNPVIQRQWVRARIESLLDQARQGGDSEQIRQQVISLALEHRMLTPYTAFVAVDSEVTAGGDAQQIRVSVPLPEGLRYEGFVGGVPLPPASMVVGSAAAFAAPPPDASTFRTYGSAPAPRRRAGGGLLGRIEKGDGLPPADKNNVMQWLESLARRQGAASEELGTASTEAPKLSASAPPPPDKNTTDEWLASYEQREIDESPIVGDVMAFDMDDDDDSAAPDNQLYDKPIEALDLSVAVFDSLKRTGITTVGDVLDYLERFLDGNGSPIRGVGENGLFEIIAKMRLKGYLPADFDSRLEAADLISTNERLQRLARKQNVNGSWNDDVETTAAALLAFVWAGHTTRNGSYRRQVSKAAAWLQNQYSSVSGFPIFAAFRVLDELQAATGDSYVTDAMRATLPEPSTDAERAAMRQPPATLPDTATTPDEMRVIALCAGNFKGLSALKSIVNADLLSAWMAVGKPTSV